MIWFASSKSCKQPASMFIFGLAPISVLNGILGKNIKFKKRKKRKKKRKKEAKSYFLMIKYAYK